MGTILVSGGKILTGETTIQGAKNAALPLMAASVLHKGITILHNCPDIRDVASMRMLLEDLGCDTEYHHHTLYIDARRICKSMPDENLTARMRGSVLLMGSLLGRTKEAVLPLPGGCVIGKRPVNYHLDLMRRLGAEVTCRGNFMTLQAKKLEGTTVSMDFPSVGATENGILAAVGAEGTTILKHCAMEPEIEELCCFLRQKGVRIEQNRDRITIQGTRELKDSEYTLMPDRIVAGTYLCAALATDGDIVLHQVPSDTILSLSAVFCQMGANIIPYQEKSTVSGRKLQTIRADFRNRETGTFVVQTAPYPGFPTDLQSQLMAACAVSPGITCRIRENIFEDRFFIAGELKKMGADIQICKSEAIIRGKENLHGAKVTVRELRGGAALILAALSAEGTSEITPDDYIKRGYEKIDKDLKDLGAEISVNDP